MKTMQGAFSRACLKRSRTRAAPDADEHLDEVGAAHPEEGHFGLARHRARQEGLARARRADEQHALGDLAADLGVFPRALEEVHDLDELFLGLVHAGHVAEAGLYVAFGDDHRLVLAEGQDVAARVAEPPETGGAK